MQSRILFHLMVYPPDTSYTQGNSDDDYNPDYHPQERIYEIVKGPVCKSNIPISIGVNLDDEGNEDQERYSSPTVSPIGTGAEEMFTFIFFPFCFR